MNSILDYTDRAIRTIAERIENSLGGTVDIVNDKREETLTVGWKKNDKTVHAVQFKKVYSYKELEKLSDPGVLVMDFIKAYTNPEEAKLLKVEQARAAKAEKVEEARAAKAEKVEEVRAAKAEKVEEARAAKAEKVEEARAAKAEKVEDQKASE